ncbi:frusctose-1,6-bisphosphatase, class II [Wolbachia endosymbiont of Armadillidium vulgare str. wVulC]|uniref:class II fructose-bisphosphatase n=1 Tax=Wolbachia endosymbiont of Armadillidium vulgare TaxID=77039 RepID=UPI00064A1034|nr:class II fructose-bisphosphatase [Wolbachia endosymbiont of Armadillidium vulgare]KLT22887.1 frusctose-1,6-bisphosphatase, class II [Wolbachia endosymbiont of Armadillidium vulgare str. wVulC]OJH31639.1 Fructose-1,6-bisphosphatase class 2 [Wolbachia endosymbiont of Armadillidium vulgare]OJH32048.1 Fructose-1,6-bisphosphatase class 2 [Wolbachia endosymbiont of Armadillidium vulgare]OJH32605.1 Fructose-1,6-bisphosphatase class 2 [Wolbachia endosymbiont of Armadillidium vulgare]OJH33227.1 Fruc
MEDLAYKLVKVTEAAASAAHKLAGLGNEKKADQVAVDAMRKVLNYMEINGTIVIGEGERDEAPMLYIGEKVGTGSGPEIDIAVDPLEGTTICAHYKQGAMSVLAATKKGNFLHAPDVYMEKIAVVPEGVVSLKNSIEKNLDNLAKAKKCKVNDLTVTILNRERHDELILKIRNLGAKIKLIDDGDVAAVVSLINGNHDMYIGTGGAPEGVLAAAALSSIGGQMEGRLIFDTDQLKERAKSLNIHDPEKIYTIKDMVRGESVFIATGVTSGEFVDGVKFSQDICLTHSLIILPGKVIKIQTKSIS